MYTIILLISHFAFFFSLFRAKWSDFSFPHLLFPHICTNTNTSTPTHKHIHTDKSTQKYTNTPTYKHIHTEIHKHTHANKPIERQTGVGVSRLWIGGSTESVLVGFDSCGSCGGDWCLWWINDLTMKGKRRRRYLWREVIWRWPWKEGGGVFHEKKKKEVEEGQILVWEMR